MEPDIKELIESAKPYIEDKLLQTRKKFELVVASLSDTKKKSELLESIREVERDIKKLHASLFNEKDLKKYKLEKNDLKNNLSGVSGEKGIGEYKILRNIPIVSLNQHSFNQEINALWSYMQFFEKEYLGLLSEQNLRLDYGHAYQRDKFYTSFNETNRFIQRYGELLEQIEDASIRGNKDYRERLVSIQGKQYRDVILRSGKFLHSLDGFIESIFEAESNGERVLLDPEKTVSISGNQASIEGLTSKDALLDLNRFVKEFIDFLKIPEIKKIEDE
jgi:hypothetical protein